MTWFIGQSILIIAAAFLLGILVGWLIWGRILGRKPAESAVAAAPAAAELQLAAEPPPSAEPEPIAADDAAEPEPEPFTAEPGLESEPIALVPERFAAEPEPDPAAAEPEPAAADVAAEPEPVVAEAAAEEEPEPAAAEPEPIAAGAEPAAEPEPELIAAEPEPESEAEPEPVVAEAAAEEEPEPVAEEAESIVVAQAAAPAIEVIPDNLERIEGIGPKMAGALIKSGIRTYEQLAVAEQGVLREAIESDGLKFAPSLVTWSRQARLLADGDEDGFEDLTRRLVAGRDEGRE